LTENEKTSYKDPPKELSFYSYRKINHFREIVTQFQGKETTHIPKKLVDDLRRQIEREKLTEPDLNYYKVKELLRQLGYNKYYEHIAYIKSMLGIPPPNFSSEFEETLCNLFLEIQGPYAEVCPDSRVNFLGYYYALYKLCEKCGQTQYLRDIPMLKDPEKLAAQDEIWELICRHEQLNWKPNVPTLQSHVCNTYQLTVLEMMRGAITRMP
jgi:protein-arginine kinase activator protein McsA